jgi:hypothetical protein
MQCRNEFLRRFTDLQSVLICGIPLLCDAVDGCSRPADRPQSPTDGPFRDPSPKLTIEEVCRLASIWVLPFDKLITEGFLYKWSNPATTADVTCSRWRYLDLLGHSADPLDCADAI